MDAARAPQKSKAELWHELKILSTLFSASGKLILTRFDHAAFTRTLTILYTITLLTLQTHIQLNLLGKHKYIQSVRELDREENAQRHAQHSSALEGSFLSILTPFLFAAEDSETDTSSEDIVDEEIERQYVTFSWWLIHIGWREVGERVRSAVEEVFDGYAPPNVTFVLNADTSLYEASHSSRS